jgi:hypothetical protein
MTAVRTLVAAAALAAASTFVAPNADARGVVQHASGWRGGVAHGGWHRGWYAPRPYYRAGWGHRGYWPGAFWGGVGLGLGIGAIGYYGSYYPYPAYPGWGTVYYDAPLVAAPVYGDDVVRESRPVPQAARAPEPIFYPNHGQSAEATENDRRECNRWATTQRGALADASIFQRATLACMEAHGYTVKYGARARAARRRRGAYRP